MFGLDEWIAGMSEGGSIAVVVLVATLLGLRHATDPDHLAAVSTLLVSGRERATRAAARLGAAWGLGHAVTLVAFGVPILLAERYLPDVVQRGAETTVAALMGTLPIALGWGAGAEARRPLGLAVVGGLLVSQTLTLYVTPVAYIYLDHLQQRLAGRRRVEESDDRPTDVARDEREELITVGRG